MELNQIWHCPRPELAKRYLALLQAGPVVSTTIFAPRRTGKTVFLRKDLTPAADAAGFTVAYVDLWQTRLNPGIAIVRGLEEALTPRTLAQKALHKLHEPVKKVKASGSAGELKGAIEVELGDAKKEATELALRIEELVVKLVSKKKLLLLVDEAQELARSKENALMAMALRTAITKNSDKLRVVFTGSSRTQLANVFSNSTAPLFSVGAAVQEFPLLGRELVEFVAKKFQVASGRTLDVAAGWTAFQEFHQQPEPFLSVVVAMLMDPSLTLERAVATEKAEQDKEENHEGTWASLDAMQRQLLLLFVNDPHAKPFGKTALAKLAKALGVPSLAPSDVQYSLNNLKSKTIISKAPGGVHTFESAAFERWVRTLAPVNP
ncbi:AAA family ATPase [Variovorax sp. LjRoot84]|uniref:AAA family ATPase n=1 Tax=Variovorax sp. LjRoot84 TaxID=3342340 RepID=UPI003ECCE9DF